MPSYDVSRTRCLISFLLCESQRINFLAPPHTHTHSFGEPVRRITGWATASSWKTLQLGARGRLPAEVSGVFVYLCLPFWSISGGFGRIQKCGLSFFSVLHADWQEKIFSCEASFSGVVTHRKDY